MSDINPQEQAKIPELPRPGKLLLFLGVLLKIWRKIENVAFVLVLLLITLYFVLQSAWVQNWLITKVSSYLSEELNTTVRVGHVDIAFFDKLALEQVYIQDLNGDTLLYAGQLTAGVHDNFFTALYNKIEFTEISLNNARCYLKRNDGERSFNYEFLLEYFSGSKDNKPKKKKTPFSVKVRNFRINDVVFIQDNKTNGKKMAVWVPKALVQINNLDIPSKRADIELVEVSGLRFDYQENEPKPFLQAEEIAPVVKDTAQNKLPSEPFLFQINRIKLEGSVLAFDRFRTSAAKTTPDNIIDFNHLLIHGIALDADSIRFNSDLMFNGRLQHFAAAEQSGFAIQHFGANRVVVDTNMMGLFGMELNTEHTHLSDTILFKYKRFNDFKRFNNDVYLEAHLKKGSVIHPYDFAYFQQSIAENSTLKKNQDLDIDLSGTIKGKINRLDGRGIELKVGKNTFMAFDFDGDDLTKGKDVMRLEFDFKRMQVDMETVRKFVPSGKIPAEVARLGSVSYVGIYNLFFGTNHVLQGKLKTNLGSGDLDMNLDLSGGREKATYSGKLNMHQFDLSALTGNKSLGKTSFNISILKGSKGLTKNSMKANIIGRVDTFTYNGYNYKSLVINGTVSESLFEGTMGITDPNIDFNFDGKVNLRDTTPIYVFKARLRRLDLGKLNFTKEDLVVSALLDNVRLTGANIADLGGVATVSNIKIVQKTGDKTYEHLIDSIRFESNFQTQTFRHFALRSDFLAASIDGNFTLSKVPQRFLQLLSHYYPKLASHLKLPAYDSTENLDLYRFGLYINNTKNLTKLFDSQLDTVKNVSIGGQVDGRNGITEMYAHVPIINYGGREFKNIVFNWRSERNKAFLKMSLPQIKLSKKYTINGINITAKIKDDVANLELVSNDLTNGVKSVNLKGEMSVADSLWQVKIIDSKFDLFGLKWAIEKDNYIRFGPKYVDIKNLELSNGLRRIILEGRNNGKGLNLILSNFDLSFVNEVVPTRGLTYRGNLSDFGLTIDNVFTMEGIELGVATDTVFVNNQPYGRIDGTGSLADLNHPFEWNVSSHDPGFNLNTTGAWLFSGTTPQASKYAPKLLNVNDLYSKISASKFPMSIIKQFISGISKVEGQFDLETVVDAKIKGKSTEIGLDGYGIIREGGFVMDYLNTPFYIKNQKVLLTDNQIWADGDTIYDATKKNMAFIKGGLRHNLFKQWKIECEVRSPNTNFVLLDTKKINNPTYYGKGVGKFVATFGGTFSKTDIKVDATTGLGSKLSIPITTESESKEANFIKFKSKVKDNLPNTPTPILKQSKFSASELKGLNVEMNLTLTEQAEIQIIFDEAAGDIITGWGNGDISILMDRDGEFKMYGNYTFDHGEYLFTLLAVNKPFKMKKGGTLAWYGDPYEAQIDITSTYRENTPLTNLLQDELAILGADNSLSQLANNSTPVDVIMRLTDDLFKPTITFDFDFPNISPQLKSYVDNKKRILDQDINEVSRQVFGLLLFGIFLPPDSFLPQSNEAKFSTLTQFVGSQLSRYVSGLAAELLGGSVSNLDINIDYQNNSVFGPNGAGASEARDLLVRMRSSFADDRITIQVGSQFGLGTSSSTPYANNSGFQGEDVAIEFQPLNNRKWKLRVYQRWEPNSNSLESDFRNSVGVGVTFSKDFDNYNDMMKGIRKWREKRKK
jgi:hypothetical protein